jgi:AAA+ ATPase superfamily predicted ATPase
MKYASCRSKNAQFIVVTGRRRVGKTHLLLRAYESEPTLYFFVPRKAEQFLCQDFQQEISDKLGVPMLGELFLKRRKSAVG